ncbi:MAG: porin family protein [Pseudomonadota bacterium]
MAWLRKSGTVLTAALLVGVLVGVASAETVTGDFGSTERVNLEAVETLKKMTPDEVQNLDALLAHALTLYYDRKFSLALPIFREIADKVATMDVMFWLGTSAANAGDPALAEAEFTKMLQLDPALHRVRLELATLYFKQGRYDASKSELEKVRFADLPGSVRENVDRMLQAIDERTRRWFGNIRGTLGYMWDDNISSGPDPGVYSLPGGTSFSPAATSAKLSDQATVAQVMGNIAYDLGAPKGLLWNSALNLYAKGYKDYGMFNYSAVDINTGPWWASEKSILKVPFGYTYTEYGSERLSYILHVDPSYEIFFAPQFSLRGSYVYQQERFFEDARADSLNSTRHFVNLTPTLYLMDRQVVISADIGYDHVKTVDETYAYTAPVAGLSLFAQWPTRTEIYAAYQWAKRNYTTAQGFPYNGLERHDTRHYYTAALSQPFFKHWFLSYVFAYTDNNSDLALYAWDKTTHTVNVGFQF